jgi:F420-dependent oxidoreductase-like protein
VDVGIHFVNFTLPGGGEALRGILADTAKAAEAGGCTTFTVMDHWFQMEQFATSQDPMLEGYTTLGYLAGVTEQMTLGLLVGGVTYRHPGLVAKIATTLDVLSGGRAMLGLGAAWYEREHKALGVPFPPLGERFERLEETLQICLQMWSDDDGPFNGEHYQLAETICEPKPVRQPHPPIWVGGSGERKTLKLVARYADACNLFSTGPAEVQHKLEVLERHCENEGRDPAEIKKTMITRADPVGDPDAFLAEMEQYANVGIEHVQFVPTTADPAATVAEAGERTWPRLRELAVASRA